MSAISTEGVDHNLFDHTFPDEYLLNIFGNVTEWKDFCTISTVCKRWGCVVRDDTLPMRQQRLDRITFHRVDHFEELPRERLELELRTFTVFQDRVVGEMDDGHLIVYDPKTKEKDFLDHLPPFKSSYQGKFLTNRRACVFQSSFRDYYQIDLENRSSVKLNFKVRGLASSVALIGKKLWSWTFTNNWWEGVFKKYRHTTLHPLLEIRIFDLQDQSTTELSYLTKRLPRLFPCEDRMLLLDRRWVRILDEDVKKIPGETFWNLAVQHISLFGKKLLTTSSSFGSEGTQTYVAIKDVGDHRNYGQEEFYLPSSSQGQLHPFFIPDLGWKFLRFDGLYWKHACWFLEKGHLTRVSFIHKELNKQADEVSSEKDRQ